MESECVNFNDEKVKEYKDIFLKRLYMMPIRDEYKISAKHGLIFCGV